MAAMALRGLRQLLALDQRLDHSVMDTEEIAGAEQAQPTNASAHGAAELPLCFFLCLHLFGLDDLFCQIFFFIVVPPYSARKRDESDSFAWASTARGIKLSAIRFAFSLFVRK